MSSPITHSKDFQGCQAFNFRIHNITDVSDLVSSYRVDGALVYFAPNDDKHVAIWDDQAGALRKLAFVDELDGAGSAINPTDNFLPYRADGSSFDDSPLEVFDGGTSLYVHNESSGRTLFLFSASNVLLQEGLVEVQMENLGVSDPVLDHGFIANNSYEATDVLQQNSPGMTWGGQGWSTDDEDSQAVGFGAYVIPSSGAAHPSGLWVLESFIDHDPSQAVFSVSDNGSIGLTSTITPGGTTGAQTINKASGSVNFAAAATSLVVTNSLVTASSIILATVGTNDTTLRSVQAVAGSGSFTLYANAAATAETRVNFLVTN